MQIILLPTGQAAISLSQNQMMSSSASSNSSEIDYDLSGGEENCQLEQPVRKRQRLDHMTEQEKLYRRKLKNRVAAQTARDKKKAKMDELEIIVQQLQAENIYLKAENNKLKAENARLNSMPTRKEEEDLPNTVERMVYPVESAALINGPLPQGQGYTPSVVLRTLLHLMLILQSSARQLKKSGLMKASVPFDAHTKRQQLKQVPRVGQQLLLRKTMQPLMKQPP